MKANFLNLPGEEIKVPVLFLVFNRLNSARRVFEEIRRVKPPKLYLAADGPRPDYPGEAEKVQAVRNFLLESVDWNCQVYTLFRDENKGCGKAVYEAIEWFFGLEEEGIILEDDVLPVQSFFWFCQELLQRFRNDERIAMISGNNHIGYNPQFQSYIFSKYKGCWGWASWRRAWKNMDFEMKWLESSFRDKIIRNMGFGKSSEKHWSNAIHFIKNGRVNTWDWQWYFSIAANNQLCIFPSVNLAGNIGFGEGATHTVGKPRKSFILKEEMVFPLLHPQYVVPDIDHDRLFERKKIKDSKIKRLVPAFLKNSVKKLVTSINHYL